MDNPELEKDLDDIDLAIVKLKRDYEIYFSGGAKLPPLEAHRRLERDIRKISRITNLNYAQRFRYNNLSARFNSYVDLWNKQMRYREEGRTPSGGVIQLPEQHVKTTGRRAVDSEANKIQKLFNDYVQSRNQTGEPTSGISLEKFSDQLTKQKETIQSKYDCKDVDFYVAVEQGKTKLKAKPVK